MNIIEKTAKTVDEAIAEALAELGIEKEDAEIEILDEGSRGFLGLGGKEASVRVCAKSTSPEQHAEKFLMGILSCMDIPGSVDISSTDEMMEIELSGDDTGILIGRRGETLNALQYLTSLVVNKHSDDYIRVSLDTENYKKKREETLKGLARKLAGNAVRYRRNITLEPMNPYERRIIHSALQNDNMVSTYSTGDEPNRKVVIVYKGVKK